ncbi:putative bifunctional diguanylate cyclase/phosphodiesterase [Novosphingobium mangrovi (ex Huang et al. 2023)]|uniref:EAL domain-containing protein n=1 Tax=Novosphingobium mangrovi (ex Huang et al. 2023) TaxID=2976432 RepID=A0ABT2I6N1_9SPHN|nr:GGDEF and EAL domain-containing protein [Novosphingobium mangrovi (ex Huang et al. 2023)]MCT2400469.1 EAL domain-containing protein [Novosphingobium mangrovi (ex Huang et al. 2023)]
MLGLSDPADGDWTRLRGLQYSSLSATTFARIATQAAAILATAALLMGQVNSMMLLGWIAVVAATLWHSFRVDRSLTDADRRRLSRGEVHMQMVGAVVNGLAWAVPLGFFGFFVDSQTQVKLWTVIAMLMTASAILLPAVPMSTLLFAGIVGGSTFVYFLFTQSYDMAAIAVIFTGTIFVGAIEGARRYIATKVAEAGILEKSEVVSLLLREFEEGEADWLWQIDTARRVRAVSPRFAFALGRDPAEIEGTPFIQLVAGSAWETGQFHSSLHDLAERLKRRENFSNQLVRVMIGGEARWWELSGTPRYNEDGIFDGFRGVGSDVTEARENSDKIAWLARYDTLTGLPNRMMLTEALGEALDYAEKWRTRCAFLMIDLDRFKAVNDTLGHLVGDQLLARVSERLKEQMSENELCGRLGGDEFAIVIRDASDLQHVDRVASQVIHRLSQPYEIDHHTLYVGASVGSAIGPRDGSTVETLMRNADLALYRSKDTGGNAHFTYEPALHAHAEERRQLEFSLRHALERNEFTVVYQPVVDAQNESVVSFEALLRWTSKDHGFVSPAKFIPLAEDTRLIVPIGEWVLQQACSEAMNWPDHVRVAVNVSGEQLLDQNFTSTVVTALAQSGLPARRLEVEVTESIFLRDATLARSALEQVMALGCGVALDDFGTGYSSLGYLRKLRFSTIKVDRSFVQGAATGNPESLAIIRAVVAMADSLDMSTTAEGAETEKEVEMIRKLGCRKIQGYFFGRPMPAEDAEALFRNPVYLGKHNAA